MAALVSFQPTQAGVVVTPANAAASDTIAESQFGPLGVYLRVNNGGGSPDNVTVSDPTRSPLGNLGTPAVSPVAAGTVKSIFIPRAAINQATGLATVTHSFLTTVTVDVERA